MIAFHHVPYPLTGRMTETAVKLALLLRHETAGEEAPHVLSSLARLAAAWADGDTPWPGEAQGSAGQGQWRSIVSGVAAMYASREAPPSDGPVPGTPGEAHGRVALALGSVARGETRASALPGGFWATFLALAWWCWQQECAAWEGVPVLWQDGVRPPDREALLCGLATVVADTARMEGWLRARVRPAHHPHSRIVAALQEDVEALWTALDDVGALLAPGAGGPALAAAWQRLCWARAVLSTLHERLAYLPAGEVPPVLYTLFEDVFAGAVPAPVTLTAVPGPMARWSLSFSSSRTPLRRRSRGVALIAVEDLHNPLAWPLFGRSVALSHPLQVAGAAPDADGGRDVLADVVAFAAFGPSYPLALATYYASRWPWPEDRSAWRERVWILQGLAEGEGMEEPAARRWTSGLLALDPPFQRVPGPGAAGPADPEPPRWEELWARVLRSPWARYRPPGPAALDTLAQGLAEGRLISAHRVGGSLPGAGGGGKAEAYQRLQWVRDVPAGSAEILHAGWRLLTGSLHNGFLPFGDTRGMGERLRTLDLLLARSLDVAAVHRLYVGGDRRDPE